MAWKMVLCFLSALFAVEASMLVGGFRDIDVKDEGVQNALNFAVVQHNRGTNDMYLHQVAEVVKAQVQVVAGMKYILTVKMEKTACRKNVAIEQCDTQSRPSNAQPYQCTFTVWSRPWMNDIRLQEEKC
ncbi:PREDICTED: cystatin-C-like [Cyprinodon variegatus]|uniref:Cystatin-C-like n=1 Tax=Cyprinodon variegatus TaxID=28743 RepID=A0A3Q2CCM6_CYPVA|nr:PREDICTED: cystatin-C-like [Cyprinodon variegatus]